MYNENILLSCAKVLKIFLKRIIIIGTDFWINLSNRVVGLLIVVTLVLYPYSCF